MTVENLFRPAGVELGGAHSWDIQVHDEAFYRRFLRRPKLELGETYMDGLWDCEQLDELMARLYRTMNRPDVLRRERDALFYFNILRAQLVPAGSHERSFHIGETHYDAGADVYRAMMDRRITCSCAYWPGSSDLEEAQEAKLELVCRKLRLEPGMRVLDIGCGFGAFAKYAAERYGVSVVGVTVSREQVALGRELCRGLPVELRYQDYREVDGTFDAIASMGMFEHVGQRFYRTWFEHAHRLLAPGGLVLLHTIGKNTRSFRSPWILKYIYPGGNLPTLEDVGNGVDGLFVTEDVHNFGADYDRTLMEWHGRFEAAWPELSERYDDRFHRMWRFYLLACAGIFRARGIQLWQFVLSKEGMAGGWTYPGNYSLPAHHAEPEPEPYTS